VFAAPRSFSQLAASFVASRYQGIHHAPLYAWPESKSFAFCSAARIPLGGARWRSGRRFPTISKKNHLAMRLSKSVWPLRRASWAAGCLRPCEGDAGDMRRRPRRTEKAGGSSSAPRTSSGYRKRLLLLRLSARPGTGGRAWNRTRDLVLIRDAL